MVDQPAELPDSLPVGELGCLLLCVQGWGKVGIFRWKLNLLFVLLKDEGAVFPLVSGWSGMRIAQSVFCSPTLFLVIV